MLLKDALPELAKELEGLLVAKNEAGLAAQVPALRIVERCRCRDDFCTSFYTQRKPQGSYGPGHSTVPLDPAEGMINVDVVDGVIVHVEVLYRPDVREKLVAVLP